MTDSPTLGTAMRAGRRIVAAIAAPTGRMRPTRRRWVLPALVALLGGGAALAYGTADQTAPAPADRAAIEQIVRDYILEHPEIIPEAVKRLQAKQMTQKVSDNRTALETPYKGAWEGASSPKVTVVAFMDYACGFCRTSLPDLARLVAENPDVRIVYHELPVITQDSVGAAKVSLLAAEQGRFMAFHKAMYAAGGVSQDAVLRAAEKAGLERSAARAAIGSDRSEAVIMENVRLARALGGEGTPLFVVGNEILTGAVGFEALSEAVEAARKAG